MVLQADNKVERLESIQNSGNYVTFSPEFSNKTIWKKTNLINQIVIKQVSFGEKSNSLLKNRTRSIPVTFNFLHLSLEF